MTDNLIVRTVVAVLAIMSIGLWAYIWFRAMHIRQGRSGYLLRGRAVVFLSFSINVALMSVAILVPGIESSTLMVTWRSVTRVHAQLLVVIIAVDIILNEVARRSCE